MDTFAGVWVPDPLPSELCLPPEVPDPGRLDQLLTHKQCRQKSNKGRQPDTIRPIWNFSQDFAARGRSLGGKTGGKGMNRPLKLQSSLACLRICCSAFNRMISPRKCFTAQFVRDFPRQLIFGNVKVFFIGFREIGQLGPGAQLSGVQLQKR